MASKKAVEPTDHAAPAALVRIRADRDGYRRGGRAWSRDFVVVDAAEFSAEQIAQIEADPRITVEPVEAPAES